MKEGKITKVIADRGFFFIDNDYWCHVNQYSDNNPEIGDIVEYEPEIKSDGKKNALKARLIMKKLDNFDGERVKSKNFKESNELSNYFIEFKKGYFNEESSEEKRYNLKKELIIDFPQMLANFFSINPNINKSSQIRKYFDQCKIIESKLKISNDFNRAVTELLQIIPLANSAKEKKHISIEFYKFLETNIMEAIKSDENFKKGFIPHFQSLIGYFK
ncbi:MAG: type III-A CRISPR-associated protein Csm2 [Bacteroidetes bacterium]|nr:type III-A CRISPR-associated protein Csm2 [Bacteroidota bacterium]